MAFVRAKASSLGAKMWDPAVTGPALPPEASLGAMCPTLEISGQVHRVPGVMSVELDIFPAVRRTPHFPGDPPSEQVSQPCKGRGPRQEPGT